MENVSKVRRTLKDAFVKHGLATPEQLSSKQKWEMQDALLRAINSSMFFAEDDFLFLSKHLRFWEWAGTGAMRSKSRWFNVAEGFYSTAVESNNVSACESYEAMIGRPPILFKGERMFVGRTFEWQGENVRCSSISNKGRFIVICRRNKRPHLWIVWDELSIA